MAHFKVPRQIEFTTELPRTATGKLKKFELREPYWAASGRLPRQLAGVLINA